MLSVHEQTCRLKALHGIRRWSRRLSWRRDAYNRATLSVIFDVIEGPLKVRGACDGLGVGAFGPEAAGGENVQGADAVGGMLLGETQPVAGIVAGAADEGMKMDAVKGSDFGFELVGKEFLDNGVENELAKLAVDLDRVALHQGLGVCEEGVVFSSRGWVLVVAIDVLAVMTGAPTARIAAEPSSVRVRSAVVPVVPRVHFRNHGALVTALQVMGAVVT